MDALSLLLSQRPLTLLLRPASQVHPASLDIEAVPMVELKWSTLRGQSSGFSALSFLILPCSPYSLDLTRIHNHLASFRSSRGVSIRTFDSWLVPPDSATKDGSNFALVPYLVPRVIVMFTTVSASTAIHRAGWNTQFDNSMGRPLWRTSVVQAVTLVLITDRSVAPAHPLENVATGD